MLNENIVKGKWLNLKGHIMKAWGDLNENELDQTKGDIGKIAGLVRQKYGEAEESVREKVNDFIAKFGNDESKSDSKFDAPYTMDKADGTPKSPRNPLNS